jgi:Reverse transcriptase (RNA-dependent DNA polymerase)
MSTTKLDFNNELDSHADTCCFGANAYLISQDMSQEAIVSGFTSELGTITTPIASVAVAYDDLHTNTTYILIFHQVLYVESLETNLLSPFQIRQNENIVLNTTPLSSLIQTQNLRDIDPAAHSLNILTPAVHIPFKLRGIMSYFVTRYPEQEEIDNPQQFPHIEMTLEHPQWDPNAPDLERIEDALRSQLCEREARVPLQRPSRLIQATQSVRRKGTISADILAKRWHIKLDDAKRTIEATTQLGVRDFQGLTGHRRIRHSNRQLHYRRLNCTCYTDTFFGPVPSLFHKHAVAQVYVTEFDWVKVYPMQSKADAHLTLDLLHHDYGAFHTMIPDDAKELILGDFAHKLRKVSTYIHPIEAYTPNQNKAEATIRIVKQMYRKAMIASNAPLILWDHCFQLMAEIRSNTALPLLALHGETPLTKLRGDTADISHLCQFEWYEPVWYIDTRDSFDQRKIGRYLGPSESVGDVMCSKILTATSSIFIRSSVFPITEDEKRDPQVQERLATFETQLKEVLRDRSAGIAQDAVDLATYHDLHDDDPAQFEPYEDDSGGTVDPMPEADMMDHDAYDKYISARMYLPDSEGIAKLAKVIRRKRDGDGKLIGKSHPNPILDTSLYEVEFEDGLTGTYAANIIAENIFEQVDDDGQPHVLFDSIVDHKKTSEALAKEDNSVGVGGTNRFIRTTKGWKLCVQWKDHSTSWVPLKDLKESNPVEVAEYAVANKIADEPAFIWWVPYTIKKRDRLIHAAKATRYLRRDQKFGLELPKTVTRALEIDAETGTTFWKDALRKEMAVIQPAIKILDEGVQAPVGYTQIPCHIIFDIKMDFTRKARFVAGGHKTEPPSTLTYASVVSRESVRIAFLIAALNDLDIMTADIQGAYLNAPCMEKVYTICGTEFGEFRGHVALIVKALYGLKSSAYAWRVHLAESLVTMGFKMCVADNDVWLREAKRKDGTDFYEYVLVYTDDILAVSTEPKEILTQLDQHYMLKPSSIGKPTQYLGAQIGEFRLPDNPDKVRWSMSSEKYVAEALRNLVDWLEQNDFAALKIKAPAPLPTTYRPELDSSEYCNEQLHHYYQQQIGVLRWAVELGRIDICTEVSMLAAHTAKPRMGHFQAMLHVFAYLRQHARSRLVFDDSYIRYPVVATPDWKDFYPNAKEDIPTNAPQPRGKEVQITAFVDSDHAGDLLTRRSRTGVLIYCNRAPIIWYSKKQASIESSTFGSEFMALKTATDLVKGLRYKLRMMGIPLDGPANMRVDNMSVVNNTTKPESVLKKKSNAIAYHYVREAVAARIMQIEYESSKTNLADMLTKTQAGPERKRLAQMVLF